MIKCKCGGDLIRMTSEEISPACENAVIWYPIKFLPFKCVSCGNRMSVYEVDKATKLEAQK
jgi:hypothetical protein